MINQKLTRHENLALAIDGEVRFPEACLLCGEKKADQSIIQQTSSSALAGSIETQTFTVPLCAECSSAHYRKKARLNIIMSLLFLLGMAAMCVGGSVQRSHTGSLGKAALIVGVVLIVLSFVVMKIKGRAFPVRVKVRNESLLVSKPVWVFKFKSPDAFERMYQANADTKERSHPATRPDGTT